MVVMHGSMEEDCTMATLLVIDDDEEELRGTLRAILEERSYAVHEARHGREGVACGQTHTMGAGDDRPRDAKAGRHRDDAAVADADPAAEDYRDLGWGIHRT